MDASSATGRTFALRRRHVLSSVPGLLFAHGARAKIVAPVPLAERRVGINYSLWHDNLDWRSGQQTSWGTPVLGPYLSNDPRILATHAEWLSGAGVDFVVLDWSNDTGMDVRVPGPASTVRFIERSTLDLFATWAAAPQAPKVAIMLGVPGDPAAVTNGGLQAKADEVHDLFVADRARAPLLETYLGKPLLLVYANTPTPWQTGTPPWNDPRFTVRFVTGYVTQQPRLLGPAGVSRRGYWSWEDRGYCPTYALVDDAPENMTVVAAWRGAGTPGRQDGATFMQQWAWARQIGPRYVIAGTFNEWWASEQIGPQWSKDVEPSEQFGWLYMEILSAEGTAFKRGI